MGLETTIAIGFFSSMFMLFLLIIGTSAFWIWMVIDCVQRDFEDKNEKVIWILILLFIQIIGALVYYFVVKKDAKKKAKKTRKRLKTKKGGYKRW